jgi:hypothetical protein
MKKKKSMMIEVKRKTKAKIKNKNRRKKTHKNRRLKKICANFLILLSPASDWTIKKFALSV